jgi:formate dehydrogenase subunit delta
MNDIAKSTVRMANQIARNFEVMGDAAAIVATSDHIISFWDPRMKAAAFALLERADAGFSDNAKAALLALKKGQVPTSHSLSRN